MMKHFSLDRPLRFRWHDPSGHIHESPEVLGKRMAQLGRTKCIQPGQLGNELSYAEIEIPTEGEIKVHLRRR